MWLLVLGVLEVGGSILEISGMKLGRGTEYPDGAN
jgi:hypothetical protein